jgi:hypothetical protein
MEGDNAIYRASSSGSCVKYLVASAFGYEDQRGKKVDDLLERSANEGNLHETAVIQMLKDTEEIDVFAQQEEINIPIIPKVFVRGHMEGLANYPDKSNQLLEIKSMSTKQFAKWVNNQFRDFERYAWQISWYMQAYPEYDVRYIVKRREDGYMTELTIPAGQPPIPLSVLRKKILIAEKYRRKGELPPCDIANQWGCPVWYLHDEDDEKEIEPLTEEMEAVLGELVAEYKVLKEIEEKGKAAEESRKKINPEILNMLGGMKQTEVTFEGVKYRVTRRGGGNTYMSKEKYIAVHGDERLGEVETKVKYEYPIIRVVEDGK